MNEKKKKVEKESTIFIQQYRHSDAPINMVQE